MADEILQEENESIVTTELNSAAYNGDKDLLLALLKEHEVDECDEQGRTPLMYASMVNQVDVVDVLLKKKASPTVQDIVGQTPLHLAASHNAFECLKLLSRIATDLNIKDIEGRTPLLLSSAKPNIRCLDFLIRKLRSSDLNEGDNERMTALHWCAYNNNSEGVRKLLQSGADIVLTDVDGKTALHWTASNDDDTTIRVLLDKAPTAINLKDKEERTVLHLAVAAGNATVIMALLTGSSVRCDVVAVDKNFRTPLHWAAVMGLSQIVGILMENGADPTSLDSTGATPLRYAAINDHEDTVETLLSFSSDDIPDGEGRTALMVAAERGFYNIVKKMIERKVDINQRDNQGATALHLAAYSGHVDICQLFNQHNADINAVDINGHSPLFRACECGHNSVVLNLLQHNALIDLIDNDGRSCLHWAASGGHEFIVTTLLHNGLPVDTLDNENRSSLHCAAYSGSVGCCSELINAHAFINQQDKDGVTPLHWACAGGSTECVQFLLMKGANPIAMDNTVNRLTPLDYAMLESHQEAAQLLMANGALSIESIKEMAAIMIQKMMRGYLARKGFKLLQAEKTKGDKEAEKKEEKEQTDFVPSLPESATSSRRRTIEFQIAESERQANEWALKSASSRALQSQLARKDRQRMTLHRQKTHAALVIQYSWRKYKRKKHYLEIEEARRKARQKLGLDHWRREIAALVIQLAWRQYQRRRVLQLANKRRRILHQWTPSVLAAKQRLLVEKVYGQELKASQYQPPKPRPMVRPAYLQLVASPAATSFNFAVNQYQTSFPQSKVF